MIQANTAAGLQFISGSGSTVQMTLDASGRVGIGVSPTGSLHTTVKDSDGSDVFVVAQNTTSNRIAGFKVLDESGTASLLMQYDNGGNSAIILNPNNGSLGIYLGGTGAANLLDSYEEGTWTPVLTTGTATVQTSKYTKVGRLVTCTTQLASFSDITSAVDLIIGGLPFPAEAIDKATTLGCLAQSIDASFGPITGGYIYTSNSLILYNTSSGSFHSLRHEDFTANTSIYISFSYMAS
jgi:hypothetical protein